MEAGPAGLWHAEKGQAWTHFMTDLRRLMGKLDDVQYGRGVEPQAREALHDHVLIRCRGDIVAKEAAVRALAIKHGFGEQFDLRWARPGDEGYIAKYVSDACNELANVAWLDRRTGEITRGARCRTWTCSERWGLTMRELKAQQAEWVRAQAVDRLAGVQARQGDAGQALGGGVRVIGVGLLDHYTESYADPPTEGVSCAM